MFIQTNDTILNMSEIRAINIIDSSIINVYFKDKETYVSFDDSELVTILRGAFAANILNKNSAQTQNKAFSDLMLLESTRAAVRAKVQSEVVRAEIAELEADLEYITKFGVQEFLAKKSGEQFPPPIITKGPGNVN